MAGALPTNSICVTDTCFKLDCDSALGKGAYGCFFSNNKK
jgi:hypothetical protein